MTWSLTTRWRWCAGPCRGHTPGHSSVSRARSAPFDSMGSTSIGCGMVAWPRTGTLSTCWLSIETPRERKRTNKERQVTETENKKLIRRYYEEVLNQGKLEVLDQIARTDHV